MSAILSEIQAILEGKAEGRYGLSHINQQQHALQAAWLAEQEGRGDALVTASLLHDIGHMIHDLGENPANFLWAWGQGADAALPDFATLHGKRGIAIAGALILGGVALSQQKAAR